MVRICLETTGGAEVEDETDFRQDDRFGGRRRWCADGTVGRVREQSTEVVGGRAAVDARQSRRAPKVANEGFGIRSDPRIGIGAAVTAGTHRGCCRGGDCVTGGALV